MSWRPLPHNHGDLPDPIAVGDSIKSVTRGLGADGQRLVTILGGWVDLAGAVMASHCRPTALRAGVLRVVVDQPGWATEVRFAEGELCRRLNALLGAGTVGSVCVQVRPF